MSFAKINFAAPLLALLAACGAEPDTAERDWADTSVAQLDVITQGLTKTGTISSGQVIPVRPEDGFLYYEVVGARCRDGSNAGVTVRRSATPSKNVLIYLQGGGACFNTQTCLPQANPERIADNHRSPAATGIFDNTDPDNPFRDWNVVYVPYCTGDFHMGNKQSSVPLGPSNQLFVGRKNLELILPSAVATFPGAKKVLLTGSSAGGAGATGNAAPVKRAFAASAPELYLINDAGPWLSAGSNFTSDYLPTAEQTKWKNLWGLDSTALPECGGLCNVSNFFPAFAKNVATQIGRKPALVVGKQDTVVALLYANARVDQYPLVGFVGVEMRDALNDYRTRMGNTWASYYVTKSDSLARQHMFLVGDNFYDVAQEVVGGGGQTKALRDWVADYVNGAAVANVGP